MDAIRISEHGSGVFLITIDRGGARNAFDEPLIEQWVERLAALAVSCPRAVVITGAGDVFCAGYDIRGIDPGQDPDLPLPDTRFERVIRAAVELPCPTLAAVNGDAFGGGLDLALACDLCVASPGAKLAMTPCRLGLVYSAQGVARLLSKLGAPLTCRLFLTALPIDADDAAKIGAVEIVETREALLPRALELAGQIATNAPLAVSGTRRTIQAVERAKAAALTDDDVDLLEILRTRALETAELTEGLAAFAQKSPPLIKGERPRRHALGHASPISL